MGQALPSPTQEERGACLAPLAAPHSTVSRCRCSSVLPVPQEVPPLPLLQVLLPLVPLPQLRGGSWLLEEAMEAAAVAVAAVQAGQAVPAWVPSLVPQAQQEAVCMSPPALAAVQGAAGEHPPPLQQVQPLHLPPQQEALQVWAAAVVVVQEEAGLSAPLQEEEVAAAVAVAWEALRPVPE